MYIKTSRVITLITTAVLNFSIAIDALGNSGITNLIGQKCTAKGTETTGSCNLKFQEKGWFCEGVKSESQYQGCNSCTSGAATDSCEAYVKVTTSPTNDCQTRSRLGFCGGAGCTPTYGDWSLWSTQSNGKTCK